MIVYVCVYASICVMHISLANEPPRPTTWWLIFRVDVYRPKGRGFDSRSSRHVGTLGKSFARSCPWRFCVKLRHSIRAVLGAPLSSRELEEALQKWSE